MLLSAEKISKNFGGRPLLTDVELYMNAGDKIGLIGRNGAGKSTLLKILAGREAPDSGRVSADPGVRISMLSQTPEMHDEMDILDQVFAGLGEAFREENEFQAKTMLTKLSIDDFSRKIGALSGGQRKRVALAEALVRYTEEDAIVNVHEDQQYFTVSVQRDELVTTRVVLLAEGRLAVAALTYPVEDMEIYAACAEGMENSFTLTAQSVG